MSGYCVQSLFYLEDRHNLIEKGHFAVFSVFISTFENLKLNFDYHLSYFSFSKLKIEMVAVVSAHLDKTILY